MSDAYIVSTARTPIGKFGGSLKDLSPVDLGAHAMKAALEKSGVDGGELDLYIFGNILRAGHGQLLPRQAAMKAGIPTSIDGYAVDMVCSSGMMTVMNAASMIKAGEADLVLAGGMESMSQAGFFLSHRARWGYKTLLAQPEPLKDVMIHDGLTDPLNGEGMGEETERVAQRHEVSREALDQVAYHSHQRAAEATAKGLFKQEIAPIEVKTRRETKVLDYDEGVRAETSLETLGNLRPAFDQNGVLTAGNSSQLSDGAAAILLASEAAVAKYNLTPVARVLKGSWSAVDSWRFVEAPIPAVKKLLDKLGKTVDDIDLIENNEAFAINSVLFNEVLGIPYEKLNVLGGSIAMGHPIGCSGARLIITLLTALEAHKGNLGIASLCHGTGGGTAVAIERL
ncbi:MAG: thiolase family protein [Chloroflexota bacterium]